MQVVKLSSVYISLLLALLLQLLPWSGTALLLRPDFVLLTLIFWVLRAPQLCNIGTAWCIGLLIDIATGGLFGQNALAYALSAFFAVIYQRRLALFNVWQQAAYVFALLLLTQATLLVLKLFADGESPGWVYFLPSVSGILLWQLVIFSRIDNDGHAKKN